MFKKLNACDYYIAIWSLYYLQGVLYPQGIINRLLQLIMILWAGIITIKSLKYAFKSPFLKVTLCLVLMYCIYGGWIIVFGNVPNKYGWAPPTYIYLQVSLNSLLPIFLFFYYTKKGLVNTNIIIRYSIIFLLVSIVMFYKNKYSLMEKLNNEEITNNMGYLFLSLLPLAFFFNKRPILQYILLAIIGIFILMGMKRGAILIGSISIVFFLYSSFKSANKKKKIGIVLLSIGIIIGGIYYISDMMQTSDFFMRRIEQTLEGDTSNRDTIYGSIWKTFLNESNIFYFVFGRGADASIGIVGNYAHQDWLETLINNGIIGGLILLSFFVVMAKTAYKQRHRFPKYMYYSFLLVLFISFAKTIFSMSIQDMHISQTLLLGYFAYWSTRPKEELQNLG